MEIDTVTKQKDSRLHIKVSHRDKSTESFAQDVLKGLSSTPKTLSPKYFYDEIGSELFEKITSLPEYYPTRSENSIIEKYSEEIAILAQKDFAFIELGSGSSTKTRKLIEAFLKRNKKLHYIPIDISESILIESAKSLLNDYPELEITAMTSDYITALNSLKQQNIEKKLIAFLGSTIGNFQEKGRTEFLNEIRSVMNDQDRLLMGIDLIKDKEIIEAAYNDSEGVTAQFNLNMLVRINTELAGNFDLEKFRHKAFLNENMGRIEMHLESTVRQSIKIGDLQRTFEFEQGETIYTEDSYKFSKQQIKEMAKSSGFEVKHSWYDPQNWFSLNLFKPI